MQRKVLILFFFFFYICSNCFCGDLERKFEQILTSQREYELKKIKNDPYKMMRFPVVLTDQKIQEMSATKVVSTKKVILSSFDKDFYYIAWYYVYDPKVIFRYLYELSDNKLLEHSSVWIQKIELDDSNSNYIFGMMDYRFPGFLHKPNYFGNYYDSNFYFQCEANRIENTLSYTKDIDTDGNDEIFSLESIHASDLATKFIIYKYVNQEWKEVFEQCYFGWEEFWSDENYTKEEWYTPKPFPYDFVEYKGKIGLRIISYDKPKDWPTHYHAQFWAYDEETQKYEMLEEIWEAEEYTPPDGLIFVPPIKSFSD